MMSYKTVIIERIKRLEHRISVHSELGNQDICLESQAELITLNKELSRVMSDENDIWLASIRLEA